MVVIKEHLCDSDFDIFLVYTEGSLSYPLEPWQCIDGRPNKCPFIQALKICTNKGKNQSCQNGIPIPLRKIQNCIDVQ